MKRIDDNNLRLNKLTSQNNLLKEKLDSIKNEIKPYKKKLDELEMILKKNHEDNQTSSLMTHNNDFEKLDKKLELMIQEKDELLNKKNQFVLNQERINNQLNLISLQEKNLQESVKELSNAHNEWIKKRDDYKSELASLNVQKSTLEKDLGILRRKRDELNSSISNKRQEINQLTLKLEYLERDISSLNEEMRSETIKLENYKQQLPDPLPSFGEYQTITLDLLQSEIVVINTKLESLEPVNMLALDELEAVSYTHLTLPTKRIV